MVENGLGLAKFISFPFPTNEEKIELAKPNYSFYQNLLDWYCAFSSVQEVNHLVVKHLSEAELESLIKQEKSKRFAERLIFIRSLYDGKDVETSAKNLGRCRATGYLWQRRWDTNGLEGLKPTFNGGRRTKLSNAQRADLKQKLQNRNWTAKEIRKLIQDEFGIDYSRASIDRLLRSFGMRYAKPHQRDYRRPDDAEAQLKNTLEVSLEKLFDLEARENPVVACADLSSCMDKLEDLEAEEKVIVGFLDECSPQSCANTVRVWSFGKVTTVKDTTKYRANTFGFYAPYGTSVVEFMENSKKESVCSFLGEIRKSNPKAKILLILDNFPSHRAHITREKAGELDILLTYLPSHSPDLNPIEQLWRCLKREISLAFFRSIDEFLAVITNAYSHLSKRLSFAENWFQKFLPQWSNQLCN